MRAQVELSSAVNMRATTRALRSGTLDDDADADEDEEADDGALQRDLLSQPLQLAVSAVAQEPAHALKALPAEGGAAPSDF